MIRRHLPSDIDVIELGAGLWYVSRVVDDVMAKHWKRGETAVYRPDALVYHERVARDDPDYYWFARNSIRFRRRNFSERYDRSQVRLCFGRRCSPSPVRRKLASALVHRNSRSIRRLRGYLDGVRYVD